MPFQQRFLALGLALAFAGLLAQPARAASCDELWYWRNAIYAEQGYCFKTDRAIAVFGPRCYPPYGRLTPGQERRVEDIKARERRKGCD